MAQLNVEITMTSTLSGKTRTKVYKMTSEQYRRYCEGEALVQNIFPEYSAEQREFLITGCTQKEWDKFLKEPEE